MKQSLRLKTSQGLAMTPQLRQSIRLLQLSALELNLEVRQALDSNMMLELDEEDTAAPVAADGAAGADDREQEDADPFDSDAIPEELPVDTAWEDIYDAAPAPAPAAAEQPAYECQDNHEQDLRRRLLWQLNLVTMSAADKLIAAALVDAINDDGYLAADLDDIREALPAAANIGADQIEAVLRIVQSLEPAGVGARDLAECLSLQLAQQDPDTPWLKEAGELVAQHLQLLAARDYQKLMRRMKLDRDALRRAINLVQSLDPRPGARGQDAGIEYITPDVLVTRANGAWKVELNQEALPRLRINASYAGMIRRADNSADNASLKSHLQEARWFIKSLQSRGETLLRVAAAVVARQRAFLEYGEEAMKPLVLHDIAASLELHDSTISRVTTGKYMHTPRGIFELKYFFSSHVGTEWGGACSATAVRALIRKLVQAENPAKPLSDSRIAALLCDQGVRAARRTVAKYREALSIPPSNERRRETA